MVKVTTDIRFDITPVEDWPDDRAADLTTDLISYVERELTTDIERALQFIEVAEQNRLWKFVGKSSMEGLFERCDLTLEAIEQYRQGVQLLRDKGYQGKITKEQATKAAIAEAKAKKESQQGKRSDLEHDGNSIKFERGTTNENILRRLARDAPEMLDKIEAGELSVNAAAIQAGIRKKPKPEEVCVKAFRKTDNRLEAIKMIVSELKEHERQMLIEMLQGATP